MTPQQKLRKDPTAWLALGVILFSSLLALAAYILAPDNSPQANKMQLSIATRPPGFSLDFLLSEPVQATTPWYQVWLFGQNAQASEQALGSYRYSGDTLWYRPYPAVDGPERFLVSSAEQEFKIEHKRFWLGTDRFGRDLLSRLLLGSRVSLAVGLVAVFISLLIGIPMGSIAAYYGGKIDAFILWFINVVWSIPGLLLVIAITLALGKGFWQVFVAIGFTMWVEVARVVRGQMLGLKEKEFVQAARVLGFSDFRIIARHLLPNCMAPLIVISAANFAAAILVESGLSFLGIGAQPPMPTWGSIIKDHYAYLMMGKAYLALAPGLAIMTLVLAFMLLGNALRDALDVRAKA